jgi:alkylhydroperoxidase family enzyme
MTEEAQQHKLSESADTPFLSPIDNPSGIMMKLAYFFTRRRFGKVITPLKVFSARMPAAFGQFYTKVPNLDKKLTLSAETILLIRQKVASINVCLYCLDNNRWAVINSSMNEAKFDALENYTASPLFNAAERAALDYATELTKEKKVTPATIARLRQNFSEQEICEIVWLVASEHLYNVTNIGLNIHSDMLCELIRRK